MPPRYSACQPLALVGERRPYQFGFVLRAAKALSLALAAAACGGQGYVTPPDTSAPLRAIVPTIPADLCGHSVLTVTNTGRRGHSIALNGSWVMDIEPTTEHAIRDYGVERPPSLPWAVEVRDQGGNLEMTFLVQPSDAALLSISDDGMSQTVGAIAAGCS